MFLCPIPLHYVSKEAKVSLEIKGSFTASIDKTYFTFICHKKKTRFTAIQG